MFMYCNMLTYYVNLLLDCLVVSIIFYFHAWIVVSHAFKVKIS
ncbi:hypothetical protein MtrunA17_Chr3g0083941 [Medicago truncatula]|uniref:Transmembrane protein n=1 Tax=Medicago truncatula TaxID=3880 RepID=A0A396IME4_MEDTR|nr:hypothetical protein MtrunA17_Chr3g0083941 [Medicago truncatula]